MLSLVKQMLWNSTMPHKPSAEVTRWLNLSLWLVTGSLFIICTFMILNGDSNSALFVVDAMGLVISMIGLLVIYTGYVRLAGYLVLSGIFALNTYGYLVLEPGISISNAIGYMVLTTIAGLFFGSYGILTFLTLALLVMMGDFIYGILMAQSMSGRGIGDFADLVSVLTVLLANGSILHVLLKRNQDAIHHIEEIAQALEISNQKLRQHQKLLEENQNQLESLVEQRTYELKEVNSQLLLEADKRQAILDALQQSEAKWRSLVNSAPDYVLTFTPQGTITFINRSIHNEFAPLAQEGVSIYDLYESDEHRNMLISALAHVQSTGQATIFETQRDTATGTLYFMHRLAAIESTEGPSGFILATTDISEHKRTEVAMRQTQKLESLGLFAGGVAHDFNNLLTAILAQNSLMLTKISSTDPLTEHIQKAILAIEQAMHLTRQMLDYTGRSLTQILPTDLGQLIHDNVALFSAALPKNVQIVLDVQGDLPYIQGDAGQLQQLLMNLMLNGADAIGKRQGQIRIIAESVQITEGVDYEQWVNGELTPGPYVMLQVVDDGCGMDDETISKMFDPFFTTKFTGRGLGLASVLGIVRNHKGGLMVESSPGAGTAFKLIFPSLPCHQKPMLSAYEVDMREFNGECVLVVDDEDAVREAAVDILTSVGLDVISASDGQTAISYYSAQPTDIKVVLLDLSMPGMSGEEVLQTLRQLNRRIPIILTSGYDERDVMSRFQAADFTSFIQKPYDLDRLLDSVARYL